MQDEDLSGVTMAGHQLAAGRMIARMAMVVGVDTAKKVFDECIQDGGLVEIKTSQDMLRFSRTLANKGGAFVEISKAIIAEVLDSIMHRAIHKLANAMGSEKARQTLDQCKTEAGITNVLTAQDMLKLANAMVKVGGVTGVIGHSLKIQALLDGGAKRINISEE